MQFSSADQTHDVHLYHARPYGDDLGYVYAFVVCRSPSWSSLVISLGVFEQLSLAHPFECVNTRWLRMKINNFLESLASCLLQIYSLSACLYAPVQVV
jgi:predicted acyltransferase